MAVWARMILMLLAGTLPATPVLAAKPSAGMACEPMARLPGLRDAGVTALSMQPQDGRCVIEVAAANGNALRRQLAAVIVETSSGHALLDDAAAEELQGWRFSLADAKGTVPALTLVRMPMRYEFVE